jgi:hypothetical protein
VKSGLMLQAFCRGLVAQHPEELRRLAAWLETAAFKKQTKAETPCGS